MRRILLAPLDPVHDIGLKLIARGLSDRDNVTDNRLLANVNPIFTWIRLAQRIPVRIHIDEVPKGFALSAGMTCSVVIEKNAVSLRERL